jgi:hypothetical protein
LLKLEPLLTGAEKSNAEGFPDPKEIVWFPFCIELAPGKLWDWPKENPFPKARG